MPFLPPGLPRMATFRRQNSEKRDRLEPVNQSARERSTRQRALSAGRPQSRSSPPQNNYAPEPASTVRESNDSSSGSHDGSVFSSLAGPNTPTGLVEDFDPKYPGFSVSRLRTSSAESFERLDDGDARTQLEAELDSKWILNLSMHFRDRSDREKFFVTYAETPTRWRRVTVSCDYRNAEPGSLEMDLKELQYQRDKSIQIYESIRDSLPEIQFYNTVTNLKLETSEGRLHVHVTEDTNEIIPYPPKTNVKHILEDEVFGPREIRESELAFDSHLSGFVYKVRHCGKDYIKKEIPGQDTVDEFLYEINALHTLSGSGSVIQLEAIVVDDQREKVKGLLISITEQGGLVDLLYDHKGEIPCDDRVRWAQQAVQGLGEIHEEGYVQGDFTSSTIVADGDNNAKIIDINRRGCPVGWEPREIAKKIQSNQRISMYIGEKSDLYQLGMTLRALAMDDDKPERHDLPLSTKSAAVERKDIERLGQKALSGALNKDLPIGIKGKRLDASADTGSDECGMPKDVADHLGLKVRCGPSDIKEFEIGDGRKIKSIGRTTVDCSFWNEPGRKLRCVFYVFERLIVPLIMGRKFLESTDTLTQHQNRLVDRPPRTGLCRVMHLTRPKRRMRCYIDSELVEANPDTGAEMELVSPDFVRRKGYTIDTPDPEHEEVQFVDGSTARTQGQVTMMFEAYGNTWEDAVPTKARYRKFYVLDGLTTDVLLGEDLLYGINAFTEHTTSFVDLEDIDRSVELKGIVWLDRAEQRLARIFGGGFSGISAALPQTDIDSDPRSRMNNFTSFIGRATGARTQGEGHRAAQRELDFEREMDNRDARENARQEAADLRIDRLSIHRRVAAEEQEQRIREAFDDDQRQRRQQREADLAAAVRRVPVASTTGVVRAGTRP